MPHPLPCPDVLVWLTVAHDDDAPECEEVSDPPAVVLSTLRALGCSYEPDCGDFVGVTLEAWEGYPAGSWVYTANSDIAWRIAAPIPVPAAAPVAAELAA